MSAAGRFPRQVWLLGWASLLTDAATEIIYPLLPAYLARVLGAGAASLGVIEGVAEGVNSTLKVVSGRLADRRSRRALAASTGFGLVYERVGAATAFLVGAAFAGLASVLLLFAPLDRPSARASG